MTNLEAGEEKTLSGLKNERDMVMITTGTLNCLF